MSGKTSGNKKELSYHYWHGKGGGDAPLLEPQARPPFRRLRDLRLLTRLLGLLSAAQKLTAEESERLAQQLRTCAAVSAWNTVRVCGCPSHELLVPCRVAARL
jgi:hypothetical protein